MKILRLCGTGAILLLLASCVTINIYFPAAQAEAAAERIVEDILGKPPAEPVPQAQDKGAQLQGTHPSAAIAARFFELLIPSAQAAEPDFNVDTPQIRRIQAGMKQRFRQLAPHFDSGGVGLTSDALVTVRDAAAISLKERNQVKKLVSDDNRDRNALYRAIAEANGHPEWEGKIRQTFAATWVKEAEKGWWYQTSSGGWKQR